MSKNVLAGTMLAVVYLAGIAAAHHNCHDDYIVPAEWELFSGTLSGVREAYYILDTGMQKNICAGTRKLIHLKNKPLKFTSEKQVELRDG